MREEELEAALKLAVKYISEACMHAPVYIQNTDWWVKAAKGEVETEQVFTPWKFKNGARIEQAKRD